MTATQSSIKVTILAGATLDWRKPFCKVSTRVMDSFPSGAKVQSAQSVEVDIDDEGFLSVSDPSLTPFVIHHLVGQQPNGEDGFLPNGPSGCTVLLGGKQYRLAYTDSPEEHEVGWFLMQ